MVACYQKGHILEFGFQFPDWKMCGLKQKQEVGEEFGQRLDCVNNLQESGKGHKNLGRDCEQQNLVLLTIHATVLLISA